jgi:hypothetical protein
MLQFLPKGNIYRRRDCFELQRRSSHFVEYLLFPKLGTIENLGHDAPKQSHNKDGVVVDPSRPIPTEN